MRALAAAAYCCFVAAAATSKKVKPPRVTETTAAPQSAQSCDRLPGVWTGYIGGKPLFDSYSLQWRDAAYPPGSFTAVYDDDPPSWSLGEGTIDPTNSTVVLVLDGGRTTLRGNVSDECTTLTWDNDSSWRKVPFPPTSPINLHLVFFSHLDVGYNGLPIVGLVNNVLNRYFTVHLPRAVALADAMRQRNGTERLIYTSHAWLVDLYIDCPANFSLSGVLLDCPPPAAVEAMRHAISRGDIVWHAAPFNIQYGGAYTSASVDEFMALSVRLAAKTGVPAPVVASLRDVPGAPRSLVPALARNGIPVLSIGVNSYAPRPLLCVGADKKSFPCVWREPATNTSIVLLETDQGVGYPNNVGPSPTDPGGLAASTCVSHPNSTAILCWAFRTDNSGPPDSVEEVVKAFDIARWQWPGANVVASSFDAWWAEFKPVVPQLSVVTQEQGETWLTGFASDPVKNALYRTATREFEACKVAGGCVPADPRIVAFNRLLMKMPEHTWGLPSINDDANYTNADFHSARLSGVQTYTDCEASWSEQRTFFHLAVAALADHPLAAQMAAAAAQLVPVLPSPAAAGYIQVQPDGTIYTVGGVRISFDAQSGAISYLQINGSMVTDPSSAAPMGKLVYQTINDTDVDAQHIVVDGDGCCCCYGWGSMQKIANPERGRTTASLKSLWMSTTAGPVLSAPVSFLAELSFPAYLHTAYGAPAAAWVNYTMTPGNDVSIDVQLFNKTATRLGEAIYLDFGATPQLGAEWFAEVLGHWVSPLDVVDRGSQKQHGVGQSVAYIGVNGSAISIVTLDAPVASPFSSTSPPSTLIVPFAPLTEIQGWSFVLFSNTYNTNFPLYSTCDTNTFPYCDYRLRFVVQLLPASPERAAAAAAAAHLG